MEKSYNDLLDGNKRWVARKLDENPDYFNELIKGQKPPILWIGCADSRVPANEITGTKPGEIFVHRNIANMVVHTDINMLSVLDYAVTVLEVKHVIVCGHYGCSGITAAMDNRYYGIMDNWIRNIKDVHRLHKEELDAITDEDQKARRFVELNIIEQVYNLSKTSIIQKAWEKREQPHLHGWAYDLSTGFISDLGVTMRDNTDMASIYKFDF